MDPTTLILNAIPAQFALPAALLVIACKLVTVFVRPPPPRPPGRSRSRS